MPYVISNDCNGCAKCINECPENSIKIKDNVCVIETGRCTDCASCSDICPLGAIYPDYLN
jgi:NAD-dependent dihydropyrimidine dehydrogenase PreA subunit